MRKILIVFILFASVYSCEIIDKDYDTYTIMNETDKNLTIIAYDKYYYSGDNVLLVDEPFMTDSINLSSFDKHTVEKRTGEDNQPGGFFKGGGEDSVIVLFNNERRLIYVCHKAINSLRFPREDREGISHAETGKIVKLTPVAVPKTTAYYHSLS